MFYVVLVPEFQASLATWVTILRIMGDLPEADYGENLAVSGVGNNQCTDKEDTSMEGVANCFGLKNEDFQLIFNVSVILLKTLVVGTR